MAAAAGAHSRSPLLPLKRQGGDEESAWMVAGTGRRLQNPRTVCRETGAERRRRETEEEGGCRCP